MKYTKRAEEDAYAKFKYDATAVQDNVIIARVAELAEKRGVTMTEISLAWLLSRVTSPVVGATKLHHIEGAAKAVDLELTDGRYGTEQTCGSKRKTRLVHRRSEDRKVKRSTERLEAVNAEDYSNLK